MSEDPAVRGSDKKGYQQILRSTSIFGGIGIFTICLGIVRNKVAAIFIGPVGVGTISAYGSVVSLVSSIAGLGIRESGIQRLAAAVGNGETAKALREVVTIRRIGLLLALLGPLAMLALCQPLSRFAFKEGDHAWAIAWLALCIPFSIFVLIEGAALQGFRKVREFAMGNLVGGVAGTLATIALIATLKDAGIVPSVIAVSLLAAAALLWQGRRAVPAVAEEPWAASLGRSGQIIRLGFAMMASGVFTSAFGYISMAFISRNLGGDSLGQSQAAWVLSTVYVGFVLNAMGTDYFPRLAESAGDWGRLRTLVNEQSLIAAILVAPGIIFALFWNETLLQLFYSDKFGPAAGILRWQILGMFLRVLSWPMGYVLPALSRSKLFFWSEFYFNVLSFALLWIGVRLFGLEGIGIAFLVSYAIYFVSIFCITNRLVGFTFSSATLREFALMGFPVLAAAVVALNFHGPMVKVAGTVFAAAVGVFCLTRLYRLAPEFRLFRYFRRKSSV